MYVKEWDVETARIKLIANDLQIDNRMLGCSENFGFYVTNMNAQQYVAGWTHPASLPTHTRNKSDVKDERKVRNPLFT